MDMELDPNTELNPPKLTSLWYSYGDKNLRLGSAWKKLKKMEFTVENGID